MHCSAKRRSHKVKKARSKSDVQLRDPTFGFIES